MLAFTVEVMQRGKLMVENEIAAEHKMIPMEEFDVVDENADDDNDNDEDSDVFISTGVDKSHSSKLSSSSQNVSASTQSSAGGDSAAASHGADGPDLHTLGRLFLPNKWFSIPFDISVILHLCVAEPNRTEHNQRSAPLLHYEHFFFVFPLRSVSILISYTLAGSLAYSALFQVEAYYRWIILPFVLVGTTLLISGTNYFPKLFHSTISLATLAKGALLVLLVFVTSRVADEVNHPATDSWRYIGRPFLIGTVAMGGAVNILPVVFAKIRFRRREVVIFTWVIIAALFFVWVLNVLWCYFLLKTIPQESPEGVEEDKNNVLTLEGAERYGKPSTVPLVSILNNYSAHCRENSLDSFAAAPLATFSALQS